MWSEIEIASSMDLLERYANLSGSRMMELICAIKALPDYRYECYRAVVIVAGSLRVLGNR